MHMIRQSQPQVLLLDLTMPEVSGFDILDHIGADPQLARLRVIVVTAACDKQVKARARELGAFRDSVQTSRHGAPDLACPSGCGLEQR